MNFKKFTLIATLLLSFVIFGNNVRAETTDDVMAKINSIKDGEFSFYIGSTHQMCSLFSHCGNFTVNYDTEVAKDNITFLPDKANNFISYISSANTDLVLVWSTEEFYLKQQSNMSKNYQDLYTTGKYYMLILKKWWTNAPTISKSTIGSNGKINGIFFSTIPVNINDTGTNFLGSTVDIYNQDTNEQYVSKTYSRSNIRTSFKERAKNYGSDGRITSIDYDIIFGNGEVLTDEEKEAYKNNYTVKYSTDEINWTVYEYVYLQSYLPYRFVKNETLYVITLNNKNNEIIDNVELTVDQIGKFYSEKTGEYYDSIDELKKMEEEYENSDLKDIDTSDNSITNKADIVKKIKSLILNKLPILDQIPRIYNSFKYDNDRQSKCVYIRHVYDQENGGTKIIKNNVCIPNVKINLNRFGLGVYDIVDFSMVIEYRETIIQYQRFFMYFTTFVILVKIIRGYFS